MRQNIFNASHKNLEPKMKVRVYKRLGLISDDLKNKKFGVCNLIGSKNETFFVLLVFAYLREKDTCSKVRH